MTVTTISRVYFHWYEYKEMLKFEAENPAYKKIAVDTAKRKEVWSMHP